MNTIGTVQRISNKLKFQSNWWNKMTLGPRFWSALGEYTLCDMAVTATLDGELWFGKSNKPLLMKFAERLSNLTGHSITYECVLQKLNDFYNRHTTWQWVTQQQGLSVDPQTMAIIGDDDVWDRIINENPKAALYKFTAEKNGIAFNIMFGYPLRVPDSDDEQDMNDVEVVEISDDDSNKQPIEIVVIADSSTTAHGDSDPSFIPSEGDTCGYSTASSPMPPNPWKKN